MSTDKEVERGLIAQSLLENPIYVESVQAVRDAIITQWENSPIRDKEGQHELKLMLKLLGDLQHNIKTVMDTGKLAKVQIEREKNGFLKAVGF